MTAPSGSASPIATSPHDAAARIAELIDDIFATIDGWAGTMSAWLTARTTVSAAELDAEVERLVVHRLQPNSLITGAGFVAAPGLLADARWHLAWWLGGSSPLRRLATIDDPDNDQFRDYTALEWWRHPERTGTRHLTGPYVDYVCTDDYTVTITAPVMVEGRMAGVVGTDALVDRLETALVPELRAVGASVATLVAASGRVVMSTDSRREPGSMLRIPGLTDALQPLRTAMPARVDATLPGGERVASCGETTLALVVAD